MCLTQLIWWSSLDDVLRLAILHSETVLESTSVILILCKVSSIQLINYLLFEQKN